MNEFIAFLEATLHILFALCMLPWAVLAVSALKSIWGKLKKAPKA